MLGCAGQRCQGQQGKGTNSSAPWYLHIARAKLYRLQQLICCKQGDAPFAAEQHSDLSPRRHGGKVDAPLPQTQLCSSNTAI